MNTSCSRNRFATPLTLLALLLCFTCLAAQKKGEPKLTKIQQQERQRALAIENNNSARTAPCSSLIDPTGCTNGDFESGTLNNSFFQGLHGKRYGTMITYSTLQCQIQSGAYNNANAHHTIVAASSADPLGIPLTTVPPNSGGNYALRLGNAVDGAFGEMVTKTFTVTPQNAYYTFDYAVVFQDPNHNEASQPTFRVRVLNMSTNTYIPNLVSMGAAGQDFVVPNSSSFFSSTNYENEVLRYSQWQCATIDLSSLVGTQITLEFINEDCVHTGHFAYTYLDNLCGGCRLPNIPKLTLDETKSSECGNGNWCFIFNAPQSVQTQLTFTVNASNGQTLLTKQSPTQNGGNGSYCFSLTIHEYDQLTQSGQSDVNIVVTGNFSENGIQLPKQFTGKASYPLSCPDYGIDFCCGPITDKLLVEQFTYAGTGGVADDYQLRFTPTPFFIQVLTQFYLYRKAIDPAILSTGHRFFLENTDPSGPTQTAGNPIGSPSTIYVNQNGSVLPNFFSQLLQVNKWYRIRASSFFKSGLSRFPKECENAQIDFRIQVSTNARHRIPSLEIRAGSQTIRRDIITHQGQ